MLAKAKNKVNSFMRILSKYTSFFNRGISNSGSPGINNKT
jgi:hypothetical protein